MKPETQAERIGISEGVDYKNFQFFGTGFTILKTDRMVEITNRIYNRFGEYPVYKIGKYTVVFSVFYKIVARD
jgi:hypothetical protein